MVVDWYATRTNGDVFDAAEQNDEVAYSRMVYSEGMLTVPTITYVGDTSIKVTTCDVLIRSDASFGADEILWKKTVAENATLAVTGGGVVNYIYITYSAGTPVFAVTTSRNDINNSNALPVARVAMQTGSIEYLLYYGAQAKGGSAKNIDRVLRIRGSGGIEKESGLSLTETGTRVVNISSGYAWFGLERITDATLLAIAQGGSGVVSELWYHTGAATWAHTTVTTYNNTQYDKLTSTFGLTTLTNTSRYAVNWIFRNAATKEINIVLGTGDYTLTEATASVMPVIPDRLANFYILCGRIIVQKSSDTAYAIENVTNVSFLQATTTVHGSLSGLGFADSGHTGFASSTQVQQITWLPQQMNFDVPPSMGGNGATITYEKLSSGIVQAYLGFTNTSVQYVFCEGVLPEDWDSAAVDITAYLRWKTASTSTNKVKWLIYGKRFTSGASRNFAVSDLLATIEQANSGAEYQVETPETTLVDMGGTGRNFVLMITRDYATESPSLAASAGLLSVEIYPTRTLA